MQPPRTLARLAAAETLAAFTHKIARTHRRAMPQRSIV
jgi:hypothetical protein